MQQSHVKTARQIAALAWREIGEYLSSPVFFVLAALFHFIIGLFFMQFLVDLLEFYTDPVKRSAFKGELNLSVMIVSNVYSLANILLLFFVPLVTMRLVADEKRLGIFELLVSTPVSDWALIAGKALGVGVLTALLALSILIYPYTASQLGAIEWGIVISGTLGLVFLTVAYTCFGVFASCLSDNPIIAAIVALGGLLLFAFLAYIGPNNSHFLSNALRGFSFGLRQKEFFNGMLRFEDFLYLVFFSGFWLFAAVRVIEARRWKQ